MRLAHEDRLSKEQADHTPAQLDTVKEVEELKRRMEETEAEAQTEAERLKKSQLRVATKGDSAAC